MQNYWNRHLERKQPHLYGPFNYRHFRETGRSSSSWKYFSLFFVIKWRIHQHGFERILKKKLWEQCVWVSVYLSNFNRNECISLYSHPENVSSYFKVICYLCFTSSISISVSSDTPNLKLVQWGAFKDNTSKILCKLLSANTKCTTTAGPAD